jgi:4'-phosphopantetheinyl transferase
MARGLLRRILSCYVDAEPDQLEFCYGPYGRPALVAPSGEKVRFNLAHSNDLALYAVPHDREVGVDIECVSADFLALQVAEHFLPARGGASPFSA